MKCALAIHLLPQITEWAAHTAIKTQFIEIYRIVFIFLFLIVSQQENVAGHGTYVEYVDSGIYATTAQGQAQM